MNVKEAIAHLQKVGYKVTPQKGGKYLVEHVGEKYGPYPAHLAAFLKKTHSSQDKDFKTGRELIRYAKYNQNNERIPSKLNKEIKRTRNHSRRMKERSRLKTQGEDAEFESEKSTRWDHI